MTSPDESLFSEAGKYVLENQNVHDCFFILGEEKKRIGAVRLFLINQSRVWWSMLSDESELAEKGDIKMPDIEPEVFILLLKYCYAALKDFSDVSDDMMLKLCYCANKYLMSLLMEKIAERLKPISVENIFPALSALTFFNLKGVEEATKMIVQSKTVQIFRCPEFLECDVEIVTYIAKQETLNCEEVDLWKALVAWAKHKAGCEAGSEIRKYLLKPLRHVRLLTLGRDALCDEVFITEALTVEEMSSLAKKKIPSHIKTLSFKTNVRRKFISTFIPNSMYAKSKIVNIIQQKKYGSVQHYSHSISTLITKNKKMVLKGITCAGYVSGDIRNYFGRLEDKAEAVVTISCIFSAVVNAEDQEPVVVNFNEPIRRYQQMKIPITNNGKKLILLQKSSYEIKLEFNDDYSCWEKKDCVDEHDFDDLKFFCYSNNGRRYRTQRCHVMQIEYFLL